MSAQMSGPETWDCFLDGAWVKPAGGQRITLHNPFDNTILAHVPRGTAEDIDAAVKAGTNALRGDWGRATAAERGRLLQRIGREVLANTDKLATAEALDVGKPIGQARADVAALARYLEFYGGAADKVHGHTIPYLDGYTVYTLREPHGVTGHIIPWNYPMQIIGRSVAAALAMGNACVLKPSEKACLTALMFAQICHDCGLPAGALNVVPGYGHEAGAALAAHPDVHHHSFTGSIGAGREVQRAAAQAVAPVTLELGGKSPQIVFDDADLDKSLPFLVNAGLQNAGQTCSAASRILVQRTVLDAVTERMAERYQKISVGNPLDDPDVGPLVDHIQRDMVEGYLTDLPKSVIAAKPTLPRGLPKDGAFIAPHLLHNLPPDHELAQDELFGPVQVILPFDDEADAIEIANGTAYGLVAGVWTADGARQMRLAKALRAGQVFINNYGAGGGVELPFGGVGMSGHGREKGFEALYGFSTLKTVAAHHG